MMGFITVTDMQMVATDTTHFPLVDLRAVSNCAHQWVAISARLAGHHAANPAAPATPVTPDPDAAVSPWHAVFDDNDLLTAIAPLDCVVHLRAVAELSPPLLARLPASRVLFAVAAAALDGEGATQQLTTLQQAGYRILIDGGARPGASPPPTLRAVAQD